MYNAYKVCTYMHVHVPYVERMKKEMKKVSGEICVPYTCWLASGLVGWYMSTAVSENDKAI